MTTVTSADIEKWAVANPGRAVKFGQFLFQTYMGQSTPDAKFGSEPEDSYVTWAKANRFEAMNLFVKLQGQIIGKK
jgi:hypothetical protein